jgi:hypothetical protein
MQTISVENWEEFETRLQKIKRTVKAGPVGLLFRGQADASWSLSTTLERSPGRIERIEKYYSTIREIKPQIETFTDRSFETPEFGEVHAIVQDYDSFSRSLAFGALPGYEYMIYLRHHGFPSPPARLVTVALRCSVLRLRQGVGRERVDICLCRTA